MDIQEEIIKSIDVIVRKYMERYQLVDVTGIVTGEKNEKTNKYQVTINGADYHLKDGVNINPTVGTAVWVHVPNGDMKNAYISARR